MIRILLPLAFVAAIFLGPMYSYPSSDPLSRTDGSATVTGSEFIENAINCVRKLKVPLDEECASTKEVNGSTMAGNLMSGAATISLAAAAIGIIGLLPFLGRLTSIVTIVAGLSALASMGYFTSAIMQSPLGLDAIGWGVYLAAGAGLLTTISGLSGMRGR